MLVNNVDEKERAGIYKDKKDMVSRENSHTISFFLFARIYRTMKKNIDTM